MVRQSIARVAWARIHPRTWLQSREFTDDRFTAGPTRHQVLKNSPNPFLTSLRGDRRRADARLQTIMRKTSAMHAKANPFDLAFVLVASLLN